MRSVRRVLSIGFLLAAFAGCQTTKSAEKTAEDGTEQMKVCKKVRRTGSRIPRVECEGERTLGLGVMNQEAVRHNNRSPRPQPQPQGR